jgi:hypothetical protein
MNTGIGDAVNLAWKLAAVVQGRAASALLDSYEPERIAFARRLVNSTDRAFTIVSSPGRFARVVRTVVIPRALPILFKSKAFRRLMFRTVSQININYRHSPLSEGSAGRLKAGDRLPWVPLKDAAGASADNFAPLAALQWQVHVYGEAGAELQHMCLARGLAVHVYPWQRAAAHPGFQRDALYLIRPDGYVAWADPASSIAALETYLNKRLLAGDMP